MDNIISKAVEEHPEGPYVKEVIRDLTSELDYQTVIDFGCGHGRLCDIFPKEKYLGLDINTDALASAQNKFLDYRFEKIGGEITSADLYLAHSVFLYMTDREVDEALRKMRCKYLLVGEILGRECSREGLPPIYNRDLADYLRLFRSHDLILHKHIKKPHEKYANTAWYQGKKTDISFLLFRKYFKKSH